MDKNNECTSFTSIMIFQNLWLGIISGGLVILTRVLGLLQLIEIDYRPDRKFRQGFTGVPAAAGGSKNKEVCSCLLPEAGKLVPYVREGKG